MLTPIKTTDKDTYANFGAPGDGYLDRYGIDDAVADGATVPIYYLGRKTEWQIDEARLDILFDPWPADTPDDVVAAIKERGVALADLARHPRRVELIANDIWTHFQAHARPAGFKAQIVAIDREAVILYKRALDRAIADDLMRRGVPEAEARERAEAPRTDSRSARLHRARASRSTPETMPVLVVGDTAIPYEIRHSTRARRRRIVVTRERVEVRAV